MIALKVKDTWLDFSPKTSVSISIQSPLFDLERIGRVFSYPFTLPATPANLQVLEHANRLDAGRRLRKYPAELYLSGNLFESGQVVVTTANNKDISLVFQNNPIATLQRLSNFKMQELDMQVTVPGAEYFPSLYLRVLEPGLTALNLYIDINGTEYWRPVGERPQIVNDINADYPGLAALIEDSEDEFSISIDTSATSPLEITLEPEGVAREYFELFINDFTEENDYRDAWQAHIQGILDDPDNHAFPVVTAGALLNNNNDNYPGIVNAHKTDGDYYLNDPETILETYSAIPMPFLKYVVETALGAAGINNITGDFLSDDDVQKLIVFNNRTVDQLQHPTDFFTDLTPEDTGVPAWNAWQAVYNLALHLPDLTIQEFLFKLASIFPIVYRISGSNMMINKIATILSSPPEDYTWQAEPGYSLDMNEYDGYILDYDRSGSETTQPGQLERVTSGEDGEDLASFISEFYTLYHSKRIYNRAHLVPYFEDGGVSNVYNVQEDIPSALLFYHGQQADANGFLYPYASHHNYNQAGSRIGEYSLDWQGADGLYEKWWKEYINLIVNGKEITRILHLPAHALLDLKNNPFRRIKIYGAQGAMVGYLKGLRFKSSIQGVALTEATIVIV